MDNKSKGLADNQDGEIILNESGTSITTGHKNDLNKSLDELKISKDENINDDH